MIINVLLWYLIVALAGWLAFPLSFRLLAFLPDRGLAFARPLGLLLWGYVYWLLVSLNVLQNDLGGVFAALLLVGGLSAWQLRNGALKQALQWLRGQRSLVLGTELLFLALFVFWAVVRAANPDASGTEKPMELAFINAILRSPAFPPSDPWLSGYAISYYYFGYVMVAGLARLSAVSGAVAFNLALATWFALTGLAVYGLLVNLLALRRRRAANAAEQHGLPLAAPLLGPLFVLLISNLEGFLEMLHARGVFWQRVDSGWQSGFWSWLNVQEIVLPPAEPFRWAPQRPAGIWWWRASRVLQDFDWSGQSREIIDEFPAFSFLLGDLHPHVLAMPFVFLAVGLALNGYLRRSALEEGTRPNAWDWLRSLEFWLAALVLGGLSFLNTWDFPISLTLFAVAALLPQFVRSGWRWQLIGDGFEILLMVGAAGVALYLPFYLGFASQANGLLPSLIFFTRGAYFWIMFGSLLLPVLVWLIWKGALGRFRKLGQGALFAAALLGGFWLLSSLFGFLRLQSDPSLAGIYGAAPGAGLVAESVVRRLASPGAWLSLLLVLALARRLLADQRHSEEPAHDAPDPQSSPEERKNLADPFIVLLVILGAGLVLFPEFFYLRDQFGWRMNTIFKFYFQTWMLWAAAAAYASAVLWQELKNFAARFVYRVTWVAVVLMALAYPLYGIWDRTNGFNPTRWTLDGSAYMASYQPDELEAIRWLQSAPYGVVVEAASLGASYTGYARVSTLSGLPAVLGWPGHESQWRGGAAEMGTREPDIAQIYKARTWDQAQPLLEKYNIRYVYVGGLERSTYRIETALFDRYLAPVFQNASVIIYQVPSYSLQQDRAVEQ